MRNDTQGEEANPISNPSREVLASSPLQKTKEIEGDSRTLQQNTEKCLLILKGDRQYSTGFQGC